VKFLMFSGNFVNLSSLPKWNFSSVQFIIFLPRNVQSAVLRLHVVCLSVRLSVCDVGRSGPHRLEILELYEQLAEHVRSSNSKGHPPTPKGTWGNFGETKGRVGKSGVQEHKSGKISKMRKDRGKATMEGL